MKIQLQQKSKILLYFLLGIALPCFLLSYFAVRGIQNDRAWYEQQLLNRNERIAHRIVETFNHRIREIEKSYFNLITSPQAKIDSTFINALDTLKISFPLIEDFFSFQESSGKIKLPASRLLFAIENKTENYDALRSIPSSPAFAVGLQNEFQQNSNHQAIENYQQAYGETQDRKLKGTILSAVARVQKKALKFQDAIKSYQTLIEKYGDIYISNGIPLGLSAQHELGFLFATLKDTLQSVQAYLKAYNDLSQGLWSLDKSQYQFWSQTVKDSLHKIFTTINLAQPFSSYLNKFQSIQAQESQQEQASNRLLIFQAEAGNFITRKISSKSESENLQFAVTIEDQQYFISLPGLRSTEEREYWGILWKVAMFKDSLLFVLNKENLLKNQVAWKIMNEENQGILASEKFAMDDARLLTRTSFINNFPDWTLELYHQNPTIIETLLTSRRSFYFYVFILIAGILAFGLFLTIRSVVHELELVKMKSDFVSSVSHELKSPLTSIRQLAEMLQTGRVPSEQRRQKYYDVIVEQSKRLALMISNVLDFAKLEEGKKQFNFELTDMDHFLKEVIAAIQQQVNHDGLEIKFTAEQSLPAMSIDRSAISQAINNLVDNAIKYSEKIKRVDVKSFIAEQFLYISVQDFGIGIKLEEVEKIFDRFYRGNDESVRVKRGSGLGLTLVKQIVKAHRGVVDVETEFGKGSTFTIKLPI